MTIGHIGDTSASGVALNADGTIDYSGTDTGNVLAGCVVGGLDANGNTIVSCGSPNAGSIAAPTPTCMPGDTLSAVNGAWVCAPGSGGISAALLIPVGILAVFAIMGAKR